MADVKSRVGGRREGAGRPPGTGPGKDPYARVHRLLIMVRRDELEKLRALAAERSMALGTFAYQLVRDALKRRKPGRRPTDGG